MRSLAKSRDEAPGRLGPGPGPARPARRRRPAAVLEVRDPSRSSLAARARRLAAAAAGWLAGWLARSLIACVCRMEQGFEIDMTNLL